MSNYTVHIGDPIAAVATGTAPAALAIIRTSGSGTIEALASLFSRPKALHEAQGNTLVYGWIQKDGKRLDEVMVAVYRAPKSYTGEEMAEIMCHGGNSAVSAIYAVLTQNAFRPAERGEFTLRSFVNGKTDLTKAEAVREIIDAKTDTARTHAVDRLSGSLFSEINRIKNLITHALAAIAVDIEYPEDEHHFAAQEDFDTLHIRKAYEALEHLASTWAAEKLYQEGLKVVLCGRTNAGKSSLFNALLKEDRSIVSDIHGTTRDWIESWASFNGIPVRLFDTAGIRQTSDTIELAGLERTEALVSQADSVLYVIDASQGIVCDDEEFFARYPQMPLIRVWNKCDILPPGKTQSTFLQEGEASGTDCFISAKKTDGIAALIDAVTSGFSSSHAKENISASLGSQRQKQLCLDALESLRYALDSAQDRYPMDAVSQDLEDALNSLGEITGEVTGDDILHAVFSQFCVGK